MLGIFPLNGLRFDTTAVDMAMWLGLLSSKSKVVGIISMWFAAIAVFAGTITWHEIYEYLWFLLQIIQIVVHSHQTVHHCYKHHSSNHYIVIVMAAIMMLFMSLKSPIAQGSCHPSPGQSSFSSLSPAQGSPITWTHVSSLKPPASLGRTAFFVMS